MYKYMIHTCDQRKWYVNKYLIPSMLEQGIQKDEIIVAVDSNNMGILYSTMQMFDWIGRTQDWSTMMWHLQDDVIISSDFKQLAETLYGDIICGFCSMYDRSRKFGLVEKEQMWYSFPCIGIKNYYAKDCADWFFEKAIFESENKDKLKTGKYVDLFFREYIQQHNKPIRIFNSNPNLVDHIDFLIGGSIVNSARDEKQVRSLYWKEQEKVRILGQKLGVSRI